MQQVLETERLWLRPWRRSDLNDLYEYAKEPLVGPRAGWEPHRDKKESRRVLKLLMQGNEEWAIVPKEVGKTVGSISLYPDPKRKGLKARMLGYALSEAFWGRGIMTEAAQRVVQYAFEELKLEVLSVYHYPFNVGSKRVIEKCGFVYEGRLRRAQRLYDGQLMDDMCYSILKEEYKPYM